MKITIQKAKPKVVPPPTITIAGLTVSQLRMLTSAMDTYSDAHESDASFALYAALDSTLVETNNW